MASSNSPAERRRRRPLLLLAAAAAVLALVEIGFLGLLSRQENLFGDWLLRLHAASQRPDPDIVIIDIDEASLEQMAPLVGRHPWPRSVYAELLEGIARQRPAAVVFDVLFTDRDLQRPADDAYLAEVAQAQPNSFFPLVRLNAEGGVPLDRFGELLGFEPVNPIPGGEVALLLPYGDLAATGRLGAINFNEDPDGTGRRYDLYLDEDGWRIPSLPARVAGALGFEAPPQPDIRLNWRGPALSYSRTPFHAIYRDLLRAESRRPANEFEGRIVIIGSTATGLHDLRATPMGSLFPAVEIVATAIDNLKNGDWLQEAAWWVPATAAIGLIGLVALGFAGGLGPLITGLGLAAISAGLGALQFGLLSARQVVPLATPLIFAWLYYGAAALYAWLEERRGRQHSVALFSRFLDPRVVHDLVARGESELTLTGESRQITVLFSDIRGFTTLSEQRSPEAIVRLLNDYFSRQLKVIFGSGGTMDKFIGDAIMAFWGAPVADDDQAAHAVAAALQMCEVLERFRSELGETGFDIGIGIHTGPAVVGFIGAENRLDYTAIGDTVNLASRIEGLTKGKARVLVSAETRRACGEAFDFVDHGFYKVKGRHQPVQLFEPKPKP